MKLTCMLVDDEPYIRLILRRVIEKTEDFEVVAECESASQALAAFPEKKPDVVFMDIDLNGDSGIDCAKAMLKQNPDVVLIFATAYAEYMPSAFELYAFDYLVKPFDIERIRHTLSRISRKNERKVLMLKGRESISVVGIEDIIMVSHEKTSTKIYTEKEVYETSRSLGEIREKLTDPDFWQCHRSYIIRVSRIKSIEPYGRWTYIVKLDGLTEDALMTKERFDELKERPEYQ